jgi:hypothetical protein
MRRLFTSLLAAAVMTMAADAAPSLEVSIGQCAAKTNAAERLACYDGIAQRLAAPTAGSVAPAVQTEAQFGAETLDEGSQPAISQPQPLKEIHSTIAKLTFSILRRAVVTLDNGQVWRQIEGDSTQFRGKEGEKVTVKRAIFSSYSLVLEDRNQMIKVQRIR